MLPDGATTPRLWNLHGETPYIAYKVDKIPYSEIIEFNGIDLQLLGFVSNLTDEQKEGVVESKMIKECWNDVQTKVYVNYSCQEGTYVGKYCQLLSESFASLLTSLGIDENDNPILLTCNK